MTGARDLDRVAVAVGDERVWDDSADRRVTWLEVAPAGEEFFRSLWRPARGKLLEAIATFTPEERATFARLLDRIADHLGEPSTPDRS